MKMRGLTWYLGWGRYIHQFQPEPTHKIHSRSYISTDFKDILPCNTSDDYQHHPNQHENSHTLCNETGHPLLSLTKVNGKWDNKDRTRIRSGSCKFKDLMPLLASGDLPLGAKGRLYSTCVGSVMLYGSETWPVNRRKMWSD